jgi:hypothetical protein
MKVLGGAEAQQAFMEKFSPQGLCNPAKAVTSKGFQEHLVKGIIENDLPYSLGENPGMLKLFGDLLPYGIVSPSHQTIQHELNVLYDELDEKVDKILQVCIS